VGSTPRRRGRRFPVRLDAEVMAWLRAKGPGFSTEINRILREKMLSEA
jgi:uncharacterized protein (DUF4415 family)